MKMSLKSGETDLIKENELDPRIQVNIKYLQ